MLKNIGTLLYKLDLIGITPQLLIFNNNRYKSTFSLITSICILFSLCFTSCNCELSFSLEKGSVGELLFVDSKTNSKIEEFGSSNFFAIKNNTYITPSSPSVLPSITNACLRQVAEDMGLKVERRDIMVEELAEFEEVNSCGTAVVITPISSIDDKLILENPEVQRHYTFGDGEHCGSVSEKLYNQIIGIQKGRIEDKYGWNLFVDIE